MGLGSSGEVLRLSRRLAHRVRLPHLRDNLADRLARPIAIVQRCEHALGFGMVLQEVEERQRHDALPQVAAHRLAERGLFARIVQDVVHDLEGHAQVLAVIVERLHLFFGRPAENGAGLRG